MPKLYPVYTNRIYGLDVYRAIAIILVVIGHSSFLLENTILDGFPWIPTIDGVELFFVLSGFLIGSILIKMVHKNEHFGFKALLHFWKRRWFRTLPNYYLILIINAILVSYGVINGDASKIEWNFLIFSQNLFEPMYGFFWESWSLSIEEWFYLILPTLFIVFFFMKPKWGFLITIAILIILPLLYRIGISDNEMDQFWWDVTFRKTVACRLDTIIYGVLAAWVKYYYQTIWNKVKFGSFTLGLVGIILMSYMDNQPNDFFTKTFYFNLTSIFAMLLLPFADSVKNYRTIIGKGFTHISIISYSMYLINLGLVAQVIVKQFPPQNQLDSLLKYGWMWAVVIIASSLLYRYFEKPMMKLRDHRIFNKSE